MADRERLYAALRNADAAGDTAAAKRLAEYIKTLPEDTSTTQAALPQVGSAEDIKRQLGLTARYGIEGVSAGAGMITDPIIHAIGGAIRAVTGSDYDPATLAKIGQSVANTLGLPQPATPTERVVGAMTRGVAGAAAPAALAGQVANVATGTTRNVAQQMAAQPAMQMASGAAAGGAGQTVAESGGGPTAQLAASLAAGLGVPGAVSATGKVKQITQAAQTGVISPEQQAILAAGEKTGVPVLTSDVLPPETFLGKQGQAMTERIPLIGTGAIREIQQTARQQAVSDIAQQYGTPSYEAIVSSLKGKVGAIKQAAGNVIDKTGQQLDAVGPVTPSKSIDAIDNAIAKLSDANVYNPNVATHINDLNELRDVLANGQQTFSTLRQSRTAVRDILDSVDPSGRSQLPTYAKKLVTGVYGAMKNDMDDFAKTNLPQPQFDKLTRANQVYGNEATILRASRLKNVLDKGDVTPEIVRNMIYSNKPSENRILYDALGQSGRQQVKSALIDDAAQKALRNGEFNPNAFGVELAKHNKKLDVFFRGNERDVLSGFQRLMQVTRRAQDAAAAPTTTGATALPYALGGAAVANLPAALATAVTGGTLARIYESAPVRNLLLKLQNTPKNSMQEARYAQSLVSAFREESERQQTAPNTVAQ